MFKIGLALMCVTLLAAVGQVAQTRPGPPPPPADPGREQEARRSPEAVCDRLAEIKAVPFKREPVGDEVYNALMQQGGAAVPCLVARVTDTTKMDDPRLSPKYHDFRVGDMAHIMLARITGVAFEQFLPSEVKAEWQERGVYAYFEYVREEKNRAALQSAWQTWLRQKPRGAGNK